MPTYTPNRISAEESDLLRPRLACTPCRVVLSRTLKHDSLSSLFPKLSRHLFGFGGRRGRPGDDLGCRTPSGKRHPHQRRIPGAALQEAVQRLQAVDLAAAETFDELHDVINAAVRHIDMIGPLTVYDIAHHLGAFLGLEPTRVYLHRGTREGARALGLGRGLHTLDLDDLPPELQRLTAAEAEDCLCIYKAQLRATLAGRGAGS